MQHPLPTPAGREAEPPLVTFAEDDTVALMRLSPTRTWEAGHVLELLSRSGIVHGFDERLFFQALELPDGRPHVVAIGSPPVAGADARVVLEFGEPDQARGRPRGLADGRVDLRELGLVQTVRAGQVLARLTPPGPGLPGRNVFGQPLPAIPGRPAALVAGRNTMLAEDGSVLWSLIDGEPYVDGARISVRPVLEIRGNVDYATGNIDFDGSVRVAGDVMPGFSVRARASIEVAGVVEGGVIEAGGQVVVQGGVRGGAVIRAHDDVAVAYVDSGSTIETASDLRVRGSVSWSALRAALAIQVGGKVVGGSTEAGEAIVAGEIGTAAGVTTHLGIRRDAGLAQIEALAQEAAALAELPPTEARTRRAAALAAELGWRRERLRAAREVTLLFVRKRIHEGVRFEVDGTWCDTESAMAPAR